MPIELPCETVQTSWIDEAAKQQAETFETGYAISIGRDDDDGRKSQMREQALKALMVKSKETSTVV
jgi:hypothetical protein